MNDIAPQVRAPKPPLEAGKGIAAIVPQNAEQAFRMAEAIAKSGMAPSGMNTPEKLTIAIFHGLEVGLPPMQAVQSIAVVNGRPTVWGDAAIGLVQASGLCLWIEEEVEGDGEQMMARCATQRVGEKQSPVVRTFSVADAKSAGLWGKQGPWQQYPRRMLQMRARAFCLRDAYADVLKGLSVREEVRDYSGPTIDAQATGGDAEKVTAALKAAPEPTPDQSGDVTGKTDQAEVIDEPAPWVARRGQIASSYQDAATPDALTAAVKAAQPHLAEMPDDVRQELGTLYAECKRALEPAQGLLDEGGEPEVRG